MDGIVNVLADAYVCFRLQSSALGDVKEDIKRSKEKVAAWNLQIVHVFLTFNDLNGKKRSYQRDFKFKWKK